MTTKLQKKKSRKQKSRENKNVTAKQNDLVKKHKPPPQHKHKYTHPHHLSQQQRSSDHAPEQHKPIHSLHLSRNQRTDNNNQEPKSNKKSVRTAKPPKNTPVQKASSDNESSGNESSDGQSNTAGLFIRRPRPGRAAPIPVTGNTIKQKIQEVVRDAKKGAAEVETYYEKNGLEATAKKGAELVEEKVVETYEDGKKRFNRLKSAIKNGTGSRGWKPDDLPPTLNAPPQPSPSNV